MNLQLSVDPRDISLWLALATATASLVQVALAYYGVWHDRRSAQAAVEEEKANAIMASDDLNTIGGYLYDQLGDVTLDQYAVTADVQARLNRIVDRLAALVSPEGELIPERGPASQPPPVAVSTEPPRRELEALYEQLGLQSAAHQIRDGNVWNGLAELRRVMEVELRRIAERHDIPTDRMGARRLLNELVARELVPVQAQSFFSFAIDVANRGVHGREVSTFEAIEALETAARGFLILGLMGARS